MKRLNQRGSDYWAILQIVADSLKNYCVKATVSVLGAVIPEIT